MESSAILRHSRRDALFLALALVHAALLACSPALGLTAIGVVALGVWWSSNTIAHNFIHRPFFRARPLNTAFSLYLTLLLGIPQSLWRERHLAHHADRPWRLRPSRRITIETALVLGLWASLLAMAPVFFLGAYLPGYALGLALCALHGHHEHAPGTVSHYGRLYNWLFFNDGYHVEHHADPGLHWSELPRRPAPNARTSPWPAVLRWLDGVRGAFSLESLERIVLRSRALQSFVLRSHERALRRLLSGISPIESVAIVGGGLFPRTALILQKVIPRARLVVIDSSLPNLERARRFLEEQGLDGQVELVHAAFDPVIHGGFDLVVIPLAFDGDREALYARATGRWLIHDWIWRARGRSEVVSPLLLKRINLRSPVEAPCGH